jgi:hypothetical protein
MTGKDLGEHKSKALVGSGKKPGFHNQAALKAAGRGQFLEALTANKGGKLAKRGLIFRIIESIDEDFLSPDPGIRREARADALKIALAMTKDDKASGLEDMLKSGANIQLNFNSYFEARQGDAKPSLAARPSFSQPGQEQESGQEPLA